MTDSYFTEIVDGQAAELRTALNRLEAYENLAMTVMNVLGFEAQEELEAWLANPRNDGVRQGARRYRRLRVLGCAVNGHRNLNLGCVSVFTNLDEIVDEDLAAHPSRGEAK